MNLVDKFFNVLKHHGLWATIQKTSRVTLNSISSQGFVNRRRLTLAKQVNAIFNGVIAYGPFKGFRFGNQSWWGFSDRAGQLLGIYEKEVLDVIANPPKTHSTFIDLGAADGYYGVGVLVNHLYQKSYCYEISQRGCETIENNAKLNQVLDRIKIRGIAGPGFQNELIADGVDLSKCVLLCDIEGGEFDLFNSEMLEAFKGSIVIVEVHDSFVENGHVKLDELKKNASQYFNVSGLTTTARDLYPFKELHSFSDTDRWLICSESRSHVMYWLKFEPKNI